MSKFADIFNRLKAFLAKESLIFYVLGLSLILKVVYVYAFTDYPHYLTTDMGGYWVRAIDRFNGDVFSVNQWVSWPPFYHIFLSYFFKVLDLFSLFPYKLQITLGMNIVLSTVSVYFLYLISLQITGRSALSLIIACSYAFSFPFVYFNAFILTENFSIPLVIIAIWCVFREGSIGSVLSGGVFLALSVAARPAFGLMGLPFFGYLALRDGRHRRSLMQGMLFALAFFAVISLVLMENRRISGGQVKGLSPGSGMSFFLSQSKIHKLVSTFDGYTYVIVPPATVNNPENGTFQTNVPIYKQDYFFDLGIKYVKEHPSVWIDNFLRLETLFFGPLLPAVGSALWFDYLIGPFQTALFVMFISMGLIFVTFRQMQVDKARFLMVLSIILVMFVTHYIWIAEQRYIYAFAFAIYIAFFVLIDEVLKHFVKYRKYISIYLLMIFLFAAVHYGKRIYNQFTARKTIRADIAQNIDDIKGLNQSRNISRKKTFYLDVLDFPVGNSFVHTTFGALGFKKNFFAEFETQFEVLHEGSYEFRISSDDGCRLIIDNELLLSFPQDQSFSEKTVMTSLERGRHRLEISYFQGCCQEGLRGFYTYSNDNGQNRYKIGQDSPYVRFIPTDVQ